MGQSDYGNRIELVRRFRPDIVALAKLASLARMIEPELLRLLRLEFGSRFGNGVRLSVSSESGLWFSPLIESRGVGGILLIPELAHLLRVELKNESPELFEAVYGVIRKHHSVIPPVIRWEEELLYVHSSPSLTEPEREYRLRIELGRMGAAIVSSGSEPFRNWLKNAEQRFPNSLRIDCYSTVFRVNHDLDKATAVNCELPFGVTFQHVLSGHTYAVRCLAFDPQGGTLASGSSDQTVKLWDVASGRALGLLDAHEGTVNGLAFDREGRTLATGSADKTAKVWDVASGRLLRSLVGHNGAVNSMAFDPQSGTLATGSADKTVKLWDVASGRILRSLNGHKGAVCSVVFDRQGGTLVSGSFDNTVKLWDVANGRLLRSLGGHNGAVNSVAFDPQGSTLGTGSADKTVKLWDVASGRLLGTLEGHTGSVNAIAFSREGSLLASKSNDDTIRLWSCATWETVAVIPVPTDTSYWIPALAFHPDEKRERALLATASSPPDTPNEERCREIHLYELDLDVFLGRASVNGKTIAAGGSKTATSSQRSKASRNEEPAASALPLTSNYRNAKVVLVGNTSVGKSGLGLVLSGRKFRATESTHGRHIWNIDTSAATVDGITEERDTLLWDLAGQPGYRQVHQLHLSEVAIALVLFDSRSETQPFDGVAYWARALDAARQNGFPLKKFLVASRCDRSGTAASQSRIDEIAKRLGFDGYFETSAKRGDGVADLRTAIQEAIEWELLPAVSRTIEFRTTKEFLVAKKKRGTIIEEAEVLFQELLDSTGKKQRDASGNYTADVFRTCLSQLEAAGLIRRLPFGDWVLLQPELLDDYCGWMTQAARAQPDGLGYLREDHARAGKFPMDNDRPLANGRKKEEQTILIAAIEETLSRGLAVRESSARDRCTLLVFPAELREELPEYPGGYALAVRFRFNGPVRGIYASLVGRLIHSMEFEKYELHKNAALFKAKHDDQRICGLAVDYPNPEDDSLGRLTVFFDDNARSASKTLFLQYINSQLEAMAFRGSIERERIYHCSNCDMTVDLRAHVKARQAGRDFVTCSGCGERFPLDDLAEQAQLPNERIKDMDAEAQTAQRLAGLLTTITQRRKDAAFDVFLCHNSQDKPAVRELAQNLNDLGLLAWIDEARLLPGDVVQEKLERAIRRAGAVIVCIGPHGLGHWKQVEYHSVYERLIDLSENDGDSGFRTSDQLRVIPVLLPGAEVKQIPAFLKRHVRVDLRKRSAQQLQEEMRKLAAGILARD